MQLCSSLNIFWHCPSLGSKWKLTFSSLVATAAVFQICWHIQCSIFTASSFRIWNSLAGIPSPPLALFVVMLPKAHLTSHSTMSGSWWVITPSWLSGSVRSFLYSYSEYSCHCFLISSAPVRSILFLSFIVTSFLYPFINLFQFDCYKYSLDRKMARLYLTVNHIRISAEMTSVLTVELKT